MLITEQQRVDNITCWRPNSELCIFTFESQIFSAGNSLQCSMSIINHRSKMLLSRFMHFLRKFFEIGKTLQAFYSRFFNVYHISVQILCIALMTAVGHNDNPHTICFAKSQTAALETKIALLFINCRTCKCFLVQSLCCGFAWI